ncbi:MAG: histidine phosphatase family protein [Lachnospiraceae bacterium]|jgi:broad specificity phosphatase PhoE|nr:histidine phosphatase family protein [Lachnospiraceae bacterium]
MRILLIRHGDPDYIHDTLTEKGHREAALLSEAAKRLETGDCYQSPLGRAQATAAYTLRKLGKTAETLDWLREFPAEVDLNQSMELQKAYNDTRMEGHRYGARIAWDMLPSYWTEHPEYSDRFQWRQSEAARCSDLISVYDSVTSKMDELLARYGYVRENHHYRVEKENSRTITFFCHFGIICVLLSHLWSVSPFVLWHTLALAPTSVSEVVSEEREKGTASFRALRLGDLSHLYGGNEPASFSARFCETFENREQRH